MFPFSAYSLLCQVGEEDVETDMIRVFSSGEQKQSAPSGSCHRTSCRLLSHASSKLFTVVLDESSDSNIMSCYFELDAQVAKKDFFLAEHLCNISTTKTCFHPQILMSRFEDWMYYGQTHLPGQERIQLWGLATNSSALNRAKKPLSFIHRPL